MLLASYSSTFSVSIADSLTGKFGVSSGSLVRGLALLPIYAGS